MQAEQAPLRIVSAQRPAVLTNYQVFTARVLCAMCCQLHPAARHRRPRTETMEWAKRVCEAVSMATSCLAHISSGPAYKKKCVYLCKVRGGPTVCISVPARARRCAPYRALCAAERKAHKPTTAGQVDRYLCSQPASAITSGTQLTCLQGASWAYPRPCCCDVVLSC